MKRDEENKPKDCDTKPSGITRRELIKGASFSLGLATTVGIAGAGPSAAQETAKSSASADRVTTEISFDPVPAPEVKAYETDILVIGAGFAGIPAAVTAREAGKSVLIVDKGHPGYSGCSPFPQCYQFFDAKYGDDAKAQTEMTMQAGEYIANLDWYKVYLEESRSCFDQLVEWGVYTPRYPKASEGPKNFYETKQEWEYHQEYAKFDRRAKWFELIEKKGIKYVDHTMIMDVIEQNGRVVGAMGLHVPSGTPITFRAKAVIMCMGIGSYKNAGYPVSGNSFDHEWIAWRHGIPVTGKEWDHLEATNSITPSSCWRNYSWGYLENIHATAGPPIDMPWESYIKGRSAILRAITDVTEGVAECKMDDYVAQGLGNSHSKDPNDPRLTGNNVDPMPVRNIYGASVGMGIFKNNGVFCGIDDLVGYTGLPGLYVAGDAHASMMYGATYTPGQGGSVSVSHIQGRRSAKAASAYVNGVKSESLDPAKLDSLSAEVLAPMKRKKGFNPRWACDVLQSVMAPWWVQIAKNENTLKSALLQVENLRDKVVPLLVARDPHDLRLCHEVAHKVLDAEMKLRASLERKESRGAAYRTDYPFRDDKNFLCYITLARGKQGEMVVSKVPVKDAWKGDTSMPYEQRYLNRFPGEAKALGLKA